MAASISKTRRTDPIVEQLVVTRISQGVRYIDISEETAVPVPTIKKIKKRNSTLLEEIKKQNIKLEAAIVLRNLQKSHRLLEQRLDRAISGQETILTKDLISISREMHNQLQEQADEPERAAQHVQGEHSLALREALEANDTAAITRIMFSNEVDT